MKKCDIPLKVVGPGSQPSDSDGAEISFMNLPAGMTTFEAPIVPEPEEILGMEQALELAHEIQKCLTQYKVGDKAFIFDLSKLDDKNSLFMDQLLGDGEVSIQYNGEIQIEIQESVLAGLWRVRYLDANQDIVQDTMEVADIPSTVTELTFKNAQENFDMAKIEIPESIYNAPPLLVEVSDKLSEYKVGDDPHIINLSLLPHTDDDISFMSHVLGIGPTIILSRGYGNCRISSTGTKNAWWVQFFNSQDTLILNTLELIDIPSVAKASKEDIEDSAERLQEILSIYDEETS